MLLVTINYDTMIIYNEIMPIQYRLLQKTFKIISTFHVSCVTILKEEFCNMSYEILQIFFKTFHM